MITYEIHIVRAPDESYEAFKKRAAKAVDGLPAGDPDGGQELHVVDSTVGNRRTTTITAVNAV